MRQVEQNLVCQMLGEQDGPFSATGWAQVESLAEERPEVVVSRMHGREGAEGTDQPTLGVGAAVISAPPWR